MSMSQERIRRWILLFIGLFFMGNGIAMVTNAQLGTTPISSVPYVVAKIMDISMGTGTFIINALMLLAQIPLLGKTFKAKQFLQLPCVFIFSIFIDIGMWITQFIIPESWGLRMLMCLMGCVTMSFGIMLELTSNTMVIPGEGFVLALAYRTRLNFGNVKVLNDVSLVMLAAILSWCFLGNIQGLREGTVVTALLTGTCIRFISARVRPALETWLTH